jgi:uncharacterized protein with HEPN domain
MPQRDELYLADIVEAVGKITARLADVTAERWASDDVLRDSVAYQMQIIGEAAASMSEETRDAIEQVPWRQVRGLRNIIVHRYFSIDWSTVLDTGRTDVASLGEQVLDYLRREHPEIAKRFDDQV